MKLDLTIGEVVTWAIVAGGFLFRSGQFTAGVAHLKSSLEEFKERFDRHAEDDLHQFEEVQKALLHLAQERK
jgi:hypothetical protein